MRSDPRNHCVPIYDTVELSEAIDKGRSCIVVMPYLVDWDRIESQTVGELVVDFCSHIFEGLQFMHNRNVAHEIGHLYIHYLHIFVTVRREWTGRDRYSPAAAPSILYSIDWDLSSQYNATIRTIRVPVRLLGYGGDQTVPEFKRNEPCNPFAVGVYCLKTFFDKKLTNESLLDKLRNVGFLRDLVADITHDDPFKQPTMVVARFEDILNGWSWWKLRSQVSDKTLPLVFHRLCSPIHWSVQLSDFLWLKSPVPKHTPPSLV
ncbi:hypothetical protein F5878DRAFT_581566 [Lentinula raphanica]|uniref:Protein kinase domain-containing protein n=1 Tax=Lentinula raphanica TaxID=153919 RepID=A0AA38PBC8_9AGAR|nr:hypothetical protein F5878DRAFT_581566 [Lentinula raphanica]